MAPPDMFVNERFKEKPIPDFYNWHLGCQGFEYDAYGEEFGNKWLGDLTTTQRLHNGLLAKFMAVDGPFKMKDGSWRNESKGRNLILIKNAHDMANEIFHGGYSGINVPRPIGLTQIIKNPSEEIYPAFIMEYVQNDFYSIDKMRQEVILRRRDDMIDLATKRGFDIGPAAHDPRNLIYSRNNDMVYVIGLSLWKKK